MAFLENLFGKQTSRSEKQRASEGSGTRWFGISGLDREFDALDNVLTNARERLVSPLEETAKQLAYLSTLIGTVYELSCCQERLQYCQDAVKSDPSRSDMAQSLRKEQGELAHYKAQISEIGDWLSASGASAATDAEAKARVLQIGQTLASQGGSKQMQLVIDRVFAIGAMVTPISKVWGEISEWANRSKSV